MSPSEHETYGAAHWQQVRRLFHRARQLPAGARSTFLGRECSGDEILRREVERMLRADARTKGFLESPIRRTEVELESDEGDLEPGHQVGPFRIVGILGEGAMGKVYRAERNDHFRMSVALKVIHAHKVDEEMLWRFAHERQILAWLDHPNIARLIDGGTLEDGRPWLALQYVEGEQIDHYCARHRLTTQQRIELFRRVCSAVEYAHGLAIVHRDLKPANILVTHEGTPKLLDFGIAKIVEGEPVSDGAPTLTEMGMAIEEQGTEGDSHPMTPRYASPEQVRHALRRVGDDPPPIGVRSDVYSLGVVLYELLTGHPPYGQLGFLKVLDRVIDEIPRPPSEVVGTRRRIGGREPRELTPEAVAAERGTHPRGLRQELKGDLDAVIHRVLEKKPDDRYASAAQLGDDLAAHLEHRPVSPRRGSRLYLAGRFFRRNRFPTLASAAVLLLIFSLCSLYWHNLQTRRALSDLGQRILDQDLSEEQITTDLHETLAGFPRALRFVEVLRLPGPHWLSDHIEELGHDLEARGHLVAARTLFEECLDMRRHLRAPPAVLAISYNNLAGVQLALGEFEKAEANYQRDLAIREEIFGPEALETSRTLNNLGALYQHWGGDQLAKARPLLEKALRIRRRELDEDDPRVLVTRNNLATQDLLEEKFAAAERIYQELLDFLPATGRARLNRAHVLRNLAVAQLGMDKPGLAEATIRDALKIYRSDFLHWRIADAESVLGETLGEQERLDEARFFLESSPEVLLQAQAGTARHAREAEARRIRLLGSPTRAGPP